MGIRHNFLCFLVGAVLSLLPVMGEGAEPKHTPPKAESGVVTLKLADTFPVTHLFNKITREIFIKKLEESGKIKVLYYPAGQMGKAEDMVELVRRGVVDIAYASPGFVAGQMPLSTVTILPDLFNTAQEGTEVLWQLCHGVLKSEYESKGVIPIIASSTPSYEIFTLKKQVKVPNDLKGMKVRGGGGDADVTLTLLGTKVVSLVSAEIYEAFQRGVIDGVSISFVSGFSYKVTELAKYATAGANLGSISTYHLMSLKSFKSLPQDLQKLIEDAGYAATMESGKRWEAQDKEVREYFVRKKGGVIYKLTPEDKKAWVEGYKDAGDMWVKSLESKGFPMARQVLNETERIAKQVVKR